MELQKVTYDSKVNRDDDCQSRGGEQRMRTELHEEQQQLTGALNKNKSLTDHLMEEICKASNLNRAYKRVKANKGAAGVDGMTVEELGSYLRQNKERLIGTLIAGSYKPQEIRAVEIPKPNGGGMRQLCIPTVSS